MQPLPRSFYTRPTITVAKDLLGKIFVRKLGARIYKGKIVETEAYLHNDPASHSFRGITERTKVMFYQGGFLYVYFTYGMHFCANVVTGKEGIGEAVLIRAVEPLEGIARMMGNRFAAKPHLRVEKNAQLLLTNGPAKFAQAFQLTTKESGTDLLGGKIFIFNSGIRDKSKIVAASRIGLTVAKEKKWRFYLKDSRWVSKK